MENLLIIEAKKSGVSQISEEEDLEKLKAYVEESGLNYDYALFLTFVVDADPDIKWKWIKPEEIEN